jgi:hypothetical protein
MNKKLILVALAAWLVGGYLFPPQRIVGLFRGGSSA